MDSSSPDRPATKGSGATTRDARRGGWFVIVAGLVLALVLALRLTAAVMDATLSSDVLYSYVFATDVLAGKYPLSGWTLPGAPYFFPDIFFHLPMLAALGPGGESFAAYAAGSGLVLIGLVAAVARWWHGCRPQTAWLAGVLAVNAALALQFLPRHGPVVWLLVQPAYHGGALLVGLALVAFTGRLLRAPAPTRWLWFDMCALLVATLCSDALVLVQFAGPLCTTVWWLERRAGAPTGTLRRLGKLFLAAAVGAVAVRLGLALVSWGYFYQLGFRQVPTPGVLLHATGKFLGEAAAELVPRAWGWSAGFAAWLVLLAADLWRSAPAADSRARAWHGLVALSTGGMVAVVVFTGFWKDWGNVRYLLNLLFLPLAVVAIAVARRVAVGGWLGGGRAVALTCGLAGVAVGAALSLDPAGWRFRPTPASRDFEAAVARHSLHRGLAGYWQADLLNVLGGTARLNTLKPDAHPYFWCNNAFWFFEPPAPDGTLRWPSYDFVLTAELDRAAVLARFGAPAEIVHEGAWEMFIYDAAGQARIRAALSPEIVEKLGPGRLRGLRLDP